MKQIIRKAIDAVKSLIEIPANDPKAPLVINTPIPQKPSQCPSFAVQGFTGNDGPPASLERHAAMTYTFLVHAINSVTARTGRTFDKWARTRNLVVVPRAGKQLNAYYDGSSLRFFYAKGRDGKMVYTCESSDIVSHEFGHAFLDFLRPDLWSVQSMEAMAIHESFGDIVAILAALCRDEVVDYVIAETGGNLRSSNIVSRLAEDLGGALGGGDSLRNAVNEFSYVDPATLPSQRGNELSSECHSFSRVFTGAFYEALVRRYETLKTTGSMAVALCQARDEVAKATIEGVSIAANVPGFMKSVARSVSMVASGMGAPFAAIDGAFRDRGLIDPLPRPMAPISMALSDDNTERYNHIDGTTVRIGGVRSVRLINEIILPQSDNPLYSVEIDIPNEHYIEFDVAGSCTGELPTDQNAALISAKMCLDYLHTNEKVSLGNEGDPDKEFSVVGGKLVRNFICCRQ